MLLDVNCAKYAKISLAYFDRSAVKRKSGLHSFFYNNWQKICNFIEIRLLLTQNFFRRARRKFLTAHARAGIEIQFWNQFQDTQPYFCWCVWGGGDWIKKTVFPLPSKLTESLHRLYYSERGEKKRIKPLSHIYSTHSNRKSKISIRKSFNARIKIH